jgi:hypothetical protein
MARKTRKIIWQRSLTGGLVSKDRCYSVDQDRYGLGVVLVTMNGTARFKTAEEAKAFAQEIEGHR